MLSRERRPSVQKLGKETMPSGLKLSREKRLSVWMPRLSVLKL